VQIRNWEELEGYYVAVLNLLEDGKIYNFYLSKKDMNNEIKQIGSSAHGDKKTASENINHEKRMSVKFDKKNKHFCRWIDKYKVDFRIK
jgi:glutamyl/glutaminyl-tRNA synthetase